MNQDKAQKLAREITELFKEQDEVVLETNDIQEFLSDGQIVDSVAAMEIVRDISEKNQWDSFVYDYGALVRFTRKPIMVNHNGKHAPKHRQHQAEVKS
ncbi:MAG TPA: hypothetical protein VKA67_08310 [Verrucomicrobiae bacterium]|nr:hypothetical protein [Verrucomicrobiae bacterium]